LKSITPRIPTRRRIFAIAAFALAALFSPVGNVEACGPFFFPETFVRQSNLDNITAFANGKLGLLQSGYDSNEYAIAFRYLNGGTLSTREQETVKPPEPNPDLMTAAQWQAMQAAEQAAEESAPPMLWQKERASYIALGVSAPPPATAPANSAGNIDFDPSYRNCPDAAYQTALFTLRRRATAWGKSSPWLADWIHAQDAVFSNCMGKAIAIPVPAPANAPELLRADRAYQTAAANFYAKKFDEAAQQFTAIAADKDSPWHDWGTYLAARATVR
jgi:hypothetical protein